MFHDQRFHSQSSDFPGDGHATSHPIDSSTNLIYHYVVLLRSRSGMASTLPPGLSIMAARTPLAALRVDAGASLSGIDTSSPAPLYHQIFSLLRDRIYEGEYPGGSFLPGEQELAAHFNVSRITAKRALDEIAAAGLAVREQGRGTRVCITPRSTSVRGGVEGLVHSLHANGRGSVQLLEFGYLPA
ncbi:MAG: GntR family transcriptional regulator, partial [Burkholderiales bacterium]